jgi:hypothetical protein
MSQLPVDRRHFTKAVTEFGEKRPVVTTRAIFNARGTKIVEAGVAVNSGLYERLMQHQLDKPLEESVASPPTVTGRMLRDNAAGQLKTCPLFSSLAMDEESRSLLLDTLERLPLPEPVAFQLTLAHEVRPDLFEHSVLSSLVAAWLAMDSRISRARMSTAAAAGLLHDLGLLHLDPILLRPGGNIDPAQRRQLYSHPLVSTVLIERHPEYSQEVAQAIREHHEFLDGSGYPASLAGEQISPVGRILAVMELVAGACAPGRSAPLRRLSVQLRMNTHRYDEALADKVLRIPGPQAEETTTTIALLTDPIEGLLAIYEALDAWPAKLEGQPDLPSQRQQAIGNLTRQVAQLQRTLARVGVTPEQLGQLGTDALGIPLQTELTLLAREAAWQLGTLAQQARRHLVSHADNDCPPELKEWVERIARIAEEISGSSAARQDDDADPAEHDGT